MLTAECLRSCAGVRAFQTSDYKLKSRIFLKCFSNLLSFFSTTMLVNEYLLMSDVWKALTPAHDPKLSSASMLALNVSDKSLIRERLLRSEYQSVII